MDKVEFKKDKPKPSKTAKVNDIKDTKATPTKLKTTSRDRKLSILKAKKASMPSKIIKTGGLKQILKNFWTVDYLPKTFKDNTPEYQLTALSYFSNLKELNMLKYSGLTPSEGFVQQPPYWLKKKSDKKSKVPEVKPKESSSSNIRPLTAKEIQEKAKRKEITDLNQSRHELFKKKRLLA